MHGRYVEIAIDLSEKIKSRQLKEGEKLKGRSIAASDYNVSPETVRKAFNLLKVHGVIEVKEKSGAFVLSRELAITFLNEYKIKNKIDESISDINHLLDQRRALDQQMVRSMKQLQSQSRSSSQVIPIEFFTIQLHESHSLIGKVISVHKIYEETGATIFGVQSYGITYSSLPENYIAKVNDILYLSGSYDTSIKALEYIK